MGCDQCLDRDECFGNEYPDEKYFHVGEIITLKGQLFRVKSVKPKELRLKLWHKTIRTVRGELL